MPFLIRLYRRFPVCCPVTYQCGDFECHGTIWNVSLMGWRVSGNLPLRIGGVCPFAVNLPIQETLYMAAGIVRWVQGEEYGIETLVVDDESQSPGGESPDTVFRRHVFEGGHRWPQALS